MMDVNNVQATLLLAQTQLEMGMANHAAALARRLMPVVLANFSLELQASTHVVLARAVLGAREPRALETASEQLQAAREALVRVNDVAQLADVCYLLARVCHQRGDVQARNEAAAQFRTLMTDPSAAQRDVCDRVSLLAPASRHLGPLWTTTK